jgi:hypothetical protein
LKGELLLKASPQNIPAQKLAHYERLLATIPAIQRKGAANPYTAVNGPMFTLLGPTGSLALRLPKAEREQFLINHKATLFESHGHIMPEFVRVPDQLLGETESMRPYLEASFAYVSSLKAKPSRRKG